MNLLSKKYVNINGIFEEIILGWKKKFYKEEDSKKMMVVFF